MKKFLKIFFFSLNFFVKFTKCYLTDSRKLLIQMLNTTKYLFFSTQNFIKKFSHLKFKNNFFYNFKLQQFNKNPILNVIKSFILIKSNYLK